MHGESTQVHAATLDRLLRIDLEALAIKEWPGGPTGVRCYSGDGRSQGGLDTLVKAGGHPVTREPGTREKKVEVALVGVGSETGENPVRLGDDGMKKG